VSQFAPRVRTGAGAAVAAVLIGIWSVAVTVALPSVTWLVDQVLQVEGLPTPPWVWPVASCLGALFVGVPAVLLAVVPRPLPFGPVPTQPAGPPPAPASAPPPGQLGGAPPAGGPPAPGGAPFAPVPAPGGAPPAGKAPWGVPESGRRPGWQEFWPPGWQPVGPRAGARVAAARASGRLWTIGAVLLAVLGSLRALPPQHNTGYLLLLAAAAAAGVLLVRRFGGWSLPRGYADSRPAGGGSVAFGVAAGLAGLAPWLWLGALGGAAETVLAAVAAVAIGRLAAAALHGRFWSAFAGSRRRQVGLGGLAAGIFLALLASGTGAAGIQLAELAVLPPLGFAAAALARPGVQRQAAIAVLVGLAAAGPLALIEPVQLGLEVNAGSRDVGFWALAAAGCALGIALLSGIGYGLGLRHRAPRWVAVTAVLATAAAGLVGYATVGSPGLHGDRLFVVLREQADLSGVAGIADVHARRTEVYRRLVATADRTQAPLRRELSRLHLSYTPYYLVNGLEVTGDPVLREWLSTRPGVDRVLLSPHLRPVPARGAPMHGTLPVPQSPQWNVRMVHADQVWTRGDTGKGIVIGTSDSGVDATHPALAGSMRPGDDAWYDPWNGSRTPTDHNGHGTHTLGTALGRGGIGVAPGAEWIGCADLDRNLGNPAYYLDCLQFMLAPFRYGGDPLRDGRPARGADVLTNSWGCPGVEGCDRDSLRPAVDALTAAGVFVVAGAGNTGTRCGSITDPPAPYPHTLTVGAVNRSGALSDFSSRGPVSGDTKPDVLAPGEDVVSALPGGGYGALSGTSMATPHVAGVVALMWSASPSLYGDVARTRQILRSTASGTPPDGCGGSAGIVDAYAAVRSAGSA
jgi:subtilisin family serine protease